jgi:hypothetical protein
MSLTPKPFDVTEKIRNRLYLPNPGRLTGVDLNQEKEAIVSALEFKSDAIGGFTRSIGIAATVSLAKTTGPLTYTLTYDIELSETGAVGSGRVIAKTVEFSPLGGSGLVNFGGTYAGPSSSLPVISWWLIAEKDTVTFADDPVMSGVNGAGFPSALSSSDTVVWKNESLVEVRGAALPALTGNFEYICKVGSVIYRDDRYLNIADDYTPIFIAEALDIESIVTGSIGLNGQSALTNLGEAPKNLSEVIQRLCMYTDDIYKRFPSLKNFSDVLSISATTVLNATHVRNLIVASGQSAMINVTTPLPAVLLDLDSVSIYQGGSFPVKLVAGTGTTIMGASEYILYQKGRAVELVYDLATTNWSVASMNTIKAYQDLVLDNTTARTIAPVDLNKALYFAGSNATVAVTLPLGINVEDGDFVHITNANINGSGTLLSVTEGAGDSIDYGNGISDLRFRDWVTLVAKRSGANVVWIPIAGNFSSSAIPKPVYAYKVAGSQTGTENIIIPSGESFDADNLMSTVTGKYVVPKAGYYKVTLRGHIYISAATSVDISYNIYKGGVNAGNVCDIDTGYTGSSAVLKFNGSTIINCAVNDELTFVIGCSSSQTINTSEVNMYVEYCPQ